MFHHRFVIVSSIIVSYFLIVCVCVQICWKSRASPTRHRMSATITFSISSSLVALTKRRVRLCMYMHALAHTNAHTQTHKHLHSCMHARVNASHAYANMHHLLSASQIQAEGGIEVPLSEPERLHRHSRHGRREQLQQDKG